MATGREGVNVEIRVAWGEMDTYGHVNNAVFLRWLETARIEWFGAVGFPIEPGIKGPVLRRATVEYLSPVTFPDTVAVSVRPTAIGRSSVTLAYKVSSASQGKPVAKGETVVVFVDFVAGQSLALPADVRSRIEAQVSVG